MAKARTRIKVLSLLFALSIVSIIYYLDSSNGVKEITPFYEDGVLHAIDYRDPKKTDDGYNLFCSEDHLEIYLMNMKGEFVHRWSLLKDELLTEEQDRKKLEIFNIIPIDTGDLLVILKDYALIKINWRGEVLWQLFDRFHHDAVVDSSGTIVALSRGVREVRRGDIESTILDDFIVEISSEGKVIGKAPLFETVGELITDEELELAKRYVDSRKRESKRVKNDSPADLFHTNSIEVLRRSLGEEAKVGDLLLSMRERSKIVVLDRETKKIQWVLPKSTKRQHDARQLLNGNILYFDNEAFTDIRGRRSQVIEYDPVNESVVWEFGKEEAFHSAYRSGAERLPNGNTLITSRNQGMVFEVTADKEVVWIYRRYESKDDSPYIYKMKRILKGDSWLPEELR